MIIWLSNVYQVSNEDCQRKLNLFTLFFYGNTKNVKKCYGCKADFKAVHTKPPNDLIMKHFCRRQYLNKEAVSVLSPNVQAAYCHFNLDCARKIQPHMERSDILLHNEIRDSLTENHKKFLMTYGIHQHLIGIAWYNITILKPNYFICTFVHCRLVCSIPMTIIIIPLVVAQWRLLNCWA